MPTVFIPFANFSLSRGRLNAGALVQADGVAHLGHGYAAPSPLFIASDPLNVVGHEIDGAVERPAFAHVNPSVNTPAFSGWILSYFENRGTAGKVYLIVDIGQPGPPWGIVHATSSFPMIAITDPEAGQFESFGPHDILAAGHDQPVKIRINNATQYKDCFTSTDKPQANYVTSIGERLLFGNIANTGTAGTPDPDGTLLWWGATDDARSIGNPVDNPEMASDFQRLADGYGDIKGLAGGKRVAYILKERGIYQMGLTNTLFGYGFDLISAGIGTSHSRSIVAQGEEVYFWSNLGPAVIRGGQVLLLGDGYWTSRGLLQESPPHADFQIHGAVADIHNGLIIWHVEYDVHEFDYDGNVNPPTEGVEGIVPKTGFIAYSYLANQFSFLWNRSTIIDSGGGSIDSGIRITEFSSVPPDSRNWYVRALVDNVQWDQMVLPMADVGMIASKATTNGAPADLFARLLASGYPEATDDHALPERIMNQGPHMATGMVQIAQDENVIAKSVRPIVRARRGRPVPTMRVWVRSSLTPFDTERIYGPYTSIADADDRNGWIATPDVAQGNFVAIELQIAAWSGEEFAQKQGEFAFWLEDIEGVEVQYSQGGKAR